MAKTTVVGKAVVVTSAMKLEDLKMIKKYRPDALVLMGGENNDIPQFSILVADKGSCIGDNGVLFSDASRDDEALAQLTMVMNDAVEGDVKEYIADEIGGALGKLEKLEATLPAVLAEIKAERDAVLASISIAQ